VKRQHVVQHKSGLAPLKGSDDNEGKKGKKPPKDNRKSLARVYYIY